MRLCLLTLLIATLILQGCHSWRVRGEVDEHGPRIEGEIGSDYDYKYDRHGKYKHGDRVVIYHGDQPGFVPPGHLPPPGHARVWHKGLPPGQQSPPFKIH